jgi:hypothetical protein
LALAFLLSIAVHKLFNLRTATRTTESERMRFTESLFRPRQHRLFCGGELSQDWRSVALPRRATLCSILGGYFRFVFSEFFAFFGVHFSDRWIA